MGWIVFITGLMSSSDRSCPSEHHHVSVIHMEKQMWTGSCSSLDSCQVVTDPARVNIIMSVSFTWRNKCGLDRVHHWTHVKQ